MPFGNFGGSGNSANRNQESNKDDFGDLFNKDWLKGGAGGGSKDVKKKMDTYAYNPVDLS